MILSTEDFIMINKNMREYPTINLSISREPLKEDDKEQLIASLSKTLQMLIVMGINVDEKLTNDIKSLIDTLTTLKVEATFDE